jgi:chemotaxis protein histidine kinase CheA
MSFKLEQKLAEFRITYIAEFNDKLTTLIKLWSEARTLQTLEAVKKFRFEVHSLKGSSGALNFLMLSDRLGMIEEEVAPCEEQINTFKSIIAFVDRHMNSMIEASKNNPNPLLVLRGMVASTNESIEPQKKINEITTQSYREINIALIDDNQNTSEINANLLDGFGFKISQYNSIEQLETSLQQQTFNLVLIDTDNSTNGSEQIRRY